MQLRDMTSLLAMLHAACVRLGISVASLFRDQEKGFDVLRPEAGYDAYTFFGIGAAAIEFDRARLARSEFLIKTPYGLAEPFTKEGQVKQGDPPSPLRFALTMAMAMH